VIICPKLFTAIPARQSNSPSLCPYEPNASVRFDINGSTHADSDSDDDQVVNLQMVSFQGNESTIVSEAINNYQDKGRAIIRFGN
jgi:hypothetical protein